MPRKGRSGNCRAIFLRNKLLEHDEFHFLSPEKALCFGVFLRAFDDLQEIDEYRKDAIRWFLVLDGDHHGFSFVKVCDALDIDPLRVLIVLRAGGYFDEYINPVRKFDNEYFTSLIEAGREAVDPKKKSAA